MFKGKKFLITGGTGSLGQNLTYRLLELGADTVRILSRNESNQIQMEQKFNDDRLRFFIGDVRDFSRLDRAFEGVDIIFHAAALKHVPLIEYNPFEAIKTNIIGTQNVIDAAIKQNVGIVVGVGTDKAVSPLNTYGATKLLMEKLFVTANNYTNPENHRTKFLALRYGNVLGSSGSVIPKFINQIKNNEKITITDPNMTRFNITMKEALDFIIDSTKIARGSEIFVPKLNAYSILDVKEVLIELMGKGDFLNVGIRPGEKLHETLINQDEMRHTIDLDDKYVIINPLSDNENHYSKKIDKSNKSLSDYSSDKVDKISKEKLKEMILELNLL